MILEFSRARSATLALAAALVLAPLAGGGPAHAEEGRVHAVQANSDLKKRADLLLRGVTDAGGKVTYGALEAGASPEALVIKDIEVTSADNKRFTVEQIEIRAMDWENAKEPRYVDMAVRKFVIAADALDKEGQDNFRDLGLTSLTISGEMAYKFDEKEKSFDVGKLFVDIAEMGELRVRLKLTGLTPGDLKSATGGEPAKPNDAPPAKPGVPGDQAMMGLLTRLNLASASIAFKDKSMVERMVRQEAKKKNMTEQAAKAKILEEMAEERAKAEDDVSKELIDAAIKFLRNPGEIEVAANPPAPANIMMAFMMIMGNRATFKQMLGLTITVK